VAISNVLTRCALTTLSLIGDAIRLVCLCPLQTVWDHGVTHLQLSGMVDMPLLRSMRYYSYG